MALKTISNIRKRSGISLPKAPKPKQPVEYDPAKQAAGYEKRLTAAGVSKAAEPRNPVEKALNLPANQGWVFDVFDIINRPQQAIFGGIASLQQGQDFGTGFAAGISGEKKTTGKDLLLGSGATWNDVKMEETDGKWWKAINAVDVLGFALDVFADPVDVALFPVSMFSGAAKKAVDLGMDTFRTVAKGIDTLDDAADLVRTADQAKDLLSKVKEVTKTVKGVNGRALTKALTDAANAKTVGEFKKAMSAYEAVAQGTRKISALQYGMRGLKMGGSKTLKFADNSIKTLLGGLDSALIRSSPEIAEKVVKFGEDATTLGSYNNITKWVTGIFDQAKNLPADVWSSVKKKSGLQKLFQQQGFALSEEMEDIISNFYAKADNPFTKEELRSIIGRAIDYEDLAVNETLMSKFAKFKEGSITNIKQNGMTPEQAIDFRNFLADITDVTGGRVFTNADELLNTVDVDGVKMVFVKDNLREKVYKEVSRYLNDVESATNGIAKEVEKLLGKEAITKISFEDAVKQVFSQLEITDPAKYARIQKQLDLYKDVYSKLSKQYDVSKYFYGNEFMEKYGTLKALSWGDELLNKSRGTVVKVYDTLTHISGSRYAFTAVRKGGEDATQRAAREAAEIATWKKTGEMPLRTGTETVLLPKQLSQQGKKFVSENADQLASKYVTRGNARVSADRVFGGGAYSGNIMYEGMIKNMLSSGSYNPKQLEELRKAETIKLFEEFIDKTLTDFVVYKAPTSFQAKLVSDIALAGTFSDSGLIKPYKGFGVAGQTVVNKEKLISKLSELKKYQQTTKGIDDAIKGLRKVKGSELLMDNVLADLLTVNNNPGTLKEVLKMFDQVNNLFKTTKLFRFAFHTVNFTGNLFNMMMAGINPLEAFSKNSGDAYKLMSGGPDLLRKVTASGAHLDPTKLAQVLTPDEQRLYRLLVEFTAEDLPGKVAEIQNYDEVMKQLKGINDSGKKNIITQMLELNGKLNEKVDNYYRMITFLHAKNNPELLARYNMASAADLVRRVHFDPSDLSGVEKDIIRRLVPFYTFTKKNLAYQLQNVAENPQLYNRFVKAVNGTWAGLGIDTAEDLDDYKRQNFWLPLIVNKDGEYIALKANLPFGDMIDFVQDPANKILSSLSPFIRAPFIELPTNTQLFTGLPIQEFEGQKGFRMPNLTRRQEYLLGQTGLDTLTQTGKDIFATGKNIFDTMTGQETAFDITKPEGIASSAVSAGSVKRTQRNKAYKELRRLQDLMRWAKQEEIDVPTLTQLENRNTTTETLINKLKRIRR